MCCLKYEEDHYEATRRRMPRVGREVTTPDGAGTVIDLNILKETVRVRIPKGDGAEQKDYPLEQVQRVQSARPGKKQPLDDADDGLDRLDEASVAEYAVEEGLTPDEALAEIEEFTEADMEEAELADAVLEPEEEDAKEKNEKR